VIHWFFKGQDKKKKIKTNAYYELMNSYNELIASHYVDLDFKKKEVKVMLLIHGVQISYICS